MHNFCCVVFIVPSSMHTLFSIGYFKDKISKSSRFMASREKECSSVISKWLYVWCSCREQIR